MVFFHFFRDGLLEGLEINMIEKAEKLMKESAALRRKLIELRHLEFPDQSDVEQVESLILEIEKATSELKNIFYEA